MIRKLPSPAVQVPTLAPAVNELPRPSLPLLSPPPVALPAPAVRITTPMIPIEPRREDGHTVQFQGDDQTVAKIERVRAMMRHRNPKGDLKTIFDAALDLLIAELEKERFAETSRPQKVQRPCAPDRIPAATRREVFARDGKQCTFTDAEGHRCEERGWLELDHVDPAALDGSNEASNLRVRCRPHNLMHAKDVFGAEHIERRIEEARKKRQVARAARRSHSASGGEPAKSP